MRPCMPERLPPQNVEAEQSLLGSLLIDKEALLKVADILSPEDFYRDHNRIVFEAILELFERHEPIDVLTLGNRLEELNVLTRIGGRATLVDLSNAVPTSAHVVHYAQIVQKKATLRRLLSAAATISELGFAEEDEVDATLDQAERALFSVSQKVLKNSFVPMRSVLSSAFERIDELHQNPGALRGVPSGFTDLDQLLAGFQRSDLIILAGRPSCGKTSLALDIARSVAVKEKLPVAFFSLEMSKEQLVDRMISSEAGVDLWKLRTGRLSERDDDFSRIGNAFGTLSEAPIYIDDSPTLSVLQLRTKARRLKTEHGIGIILIDYLQLMEGNKKSSANSDNRVQEVSEISRGLKQIARELQVPVIALAQLSRAVEQNKPAIPRLSHLRDSGSIEQDADVVMFIYRKAADRGYRPEELTPEEKNLAEIHIAKHRNGPTGIVRLFFQSERTTFLNLDRRSPPPPNLAPPPVAKTANTIVAAPPVSPPPPLDSLSTPPPPIEYPSPPPIG